MYGFMKLTRIGFSVSVFVLSIFLSLISCRNDKIEVSSKHINSTINNTSPTIKVFLENSGSMDGYMCDGSDLKDAMYAYLSDLLRFVQTLK